MEFTEKEASGAGREIPNNDSTNAAKATHTNKQFRINSEKDVMIYAAWPMLGLLMRKNHNLHISLIHPEVEFDRNPVAGKYNIVVLVAGGPTC